MPRLSALTYWVPRRACAFVRSRKRLLYSKEVWKVSIDSPRKVKFVNATVPLNAKVGVEKPKFDGPIRATWAKGKLTVAVE